MFTMRSAATAAVVLTLAGSASAGLAPTFWTGYDFEFVKTGFAGTGEAEQDRITDTVWITRGETQGIFNAAAEPGYSGDPSPLGTLWAFGTIADGVETLDFQFWRIWNNFNPPGSVGLDAVLYIPAEELYIDIRFTSWGIGGGAGGAFSYVRGIPAPGSAAVLGLAGLVATRRRR